MNFYREIIKLAWPITLGMLNNAIMQFTDRAFLAHESLASLEAVLPGGLLAFFFLCFWHSVVAYSGVFVAQYCGAKNPRGMCLSYRAGLIIACFAGVFCLAFLPLGDLIFTLANHSPEVMAREKTYFAILIMGGIALFSQMAAQSYFTGRGKTRIVFVVNVIGNLFNIALDPFLIFGWWIFPKCGIAGAALATVCAMFLQGILLGILAMRDLECRPAWRESRKELTDIIKRVLRFGIPSGGHTIFDLLSFTIFVFITGGVGDFAFAVSNACFSICYLLFAPIQGFSLAASTLVGQAQGRGDSRAARAVGNQSVVLSVCFIAILEIIILAAHRPILGFFAKHISSLSEFYSLGLTLLSLMAIWELLDAADVAWLGALKGAGDTRFVFLWMLIVAFGIWLPCVFLVAKFHNTMPALWATTILEMAVLFVGTVWRWRKGKWETIQVVEK